MSRSHKLLSAFDAISIEGSLLPADWLARIATLDAPQQTPQDYGIPKGLSLRDELGRYWRIANAHWQDFAAARANATNPHALATRFISGLLRDVFGAADLQPCTSPLLLDERSWPLSALAGAGRQPVVIGIPGTPLDRRDAAFGDTGRQRSAFGLLQDYLNATDSALWGVVSNGDTLRIARDNASLTRPAWIEADLARIFTEERFADFSLLWLALHASRFGRAGAPPAQCPLEAWRNASRDEGTRARDLLRDGVTQALQELGQGFLAHPANDALRQKIRGGQLSSQAYFRQLLRLVYRLIFLLTIEERGLLHPSDTDADAIALYAQGYSLRRLVDRSRRRSAFGRHADLWEGLKPVFNGLAQGQPLLALPALGGLFAERQCPDLDAAQLPNRALLGALSALGWLRIGGALTRTNWRDMKYEEFGSVYESLLELVPDVTNEARDFGFANTEQARGNERKTTGSYYTPDDLVQQLLDSALEPVIEQRLADAADPEAALLSITVCDPACGSGHFLLAAGFRLADRLARIRAGGTPGATEYRAALRDVVSHCLYGVDLNPMALELARTALWLEAMTPDKPLNFLDHHLQVGDALLGILDTRVLDAGIPDDACKALTGDDKKLAAAARKQNKTERDSWQRALATGGLFAAEQLATSAAVLDELADDSLDAIAAKRQAWREAQDVAASSRLARLANLYVGAFLLAKTAENQATLPSSRHVWAVANNQPATGLAEAEDASHTACTEARVFHWWLAFPQIHAQGGFAVLLANPPWERIKLQEQEFFASRNVHIAKARNKAERGRYIECLAKGTLAAQLDGLAAASPAQAEAERQLFAEFQTARRIAEATSTFVHVKEGRYPLTGVGDVNTYALFAETFAQLRQKHGRAGFIVPTGIATDDSTKAYFAKISGSGWLASLLDFENRERIFPAVDSRVKFSLITLGEAESARFVCFATQISHLADARREFTLTPEEFALINPNTRTCPIFRSKRDADLTKKLYGAAPVLVREPVLDEEGNLVEAEVNQWNIRIRRIFDMAKAEVVGLCSTSPKRGFIPMYEAKMMHQFDHRWATYVPKADGELETREISDAQKAGPALIVAPRYWVETIEVLARIARAPNDVRKAWLAAHRADPEAIAEARSALWLALAQWVAGELFRREAGAAAAGSYAKPQILRASPIVEKNLANQWPACMNALHVAKIDSKKLRKELPKWALRDTDVSLDDDELATLAALATRADPGGDDELLRELDTWMDRRSPRWLMGWRDICRATDERTVIASIAARGGTDFTLRVCLSVLRDARAALLLANLNSLVLDYATRQKIGGTHLADFVTKQLPVLPPNHYTEADLAFIVPRVLELTYTAHDLTDWARDLGHTGPPFAWNPDRRAQLRAELDAWYARAYGLSRNELRYILDPHDVEGPDYPSETFRVLRKNEEASHGEYRTRRLVLDAWDKLQQGELH